MSLFGVLVSRGLRAQIVNKMVMEEWRLNVSIAISIARV